jgi:hypothetical protein
VYGFYCFVGVFVFLPELAAIAADEEQQEELRQILFCLFFCFRYG